MWTWDVTTGRVDWSERLHEIYGLEPGTFDGTYESYLERIHPEDRESSSSAALQNAANHMTHHTLHRTVTPAGELRWIEGWGTPIVEDGKVVAMTGIGRDVTARELEKQRAAERAETADGLLRLSRVAIGSGGLDSLAERVARTAADLVGAESAAVVINCRDDDLPPRHQGSEGPDGVFLSTANAERLPPGPATLVISDPTRSTSDQAAFEEIFGVAVPSSLRSVMLVQLPTRASDLGGLLAFGHARPDQFGVAEERLARAMAGVVKLAARSELRFEQQRIAAQLFQRSLLPPEQFELPGVEVCVRYHPGRDGFDVGGDWYDVIELPGGRLGLAVGDVCGHGLEAAANMGRFRHALRAMLQSGTSPADALETMNQIALREAATTVTLSYVEIDESRSFLQCWSCGHLPPVIASPDGRGLRWVETPGSAPMLGFLPGVEPVPSTDHLEPGELLLLYTDGLIERRGETMTEGLSRLAGAFVGRSDDIDDLCDELYHVLVAPGPDTDDTAMVALRRR